MATIADVIEGEHAVIREQRANRGAPAPAPDDKDPFAFRVPDQYWGLALSGGGIRSASFALGVMQALATTGMLRRIDYLSTVSGGGYIGTSLTWLNFLRSGGELPQLRTTLFPLGRQFAGSRNAPRVSGPLDYIRHHADYLRPAHLLNNFSLAGVVLRNLVLSLSVFFALTVAVLGLLRYSGFVIPAWESFPYLAAYMGALFAIGTVLYAFISWALPALGSVGGRVGAAAQTAVYRAAIDMQRMLGLILTYLIVIGLAMLVPPVAQSLSSTNPRFELIRRFWWAFPAALVLCVAIVLIVGRVRAAQREIADAPQPSGIGLKLVAIGFAFAWFVLAYRATDELNRAPGLSGQALSLVVLMVALVGGFFVHTNYFGIGRMYRDRLMEAFLPSPTSIERNEWAPAVSANFTMLKDANGVTDIGPYHLINTTLVLTAHPKVKFTQRGGDNYLLSHAFCGCDAVAPDAAGEHGWIATTELPGKPVSWATAMATSGAAVNPGAGVGGEGVTRSRIVAFAMALLNVRLGYWLPNFHREFAFPKGLWVRYLFPNLLFPGILQGLFGASQGPNSGYLQLTDGGHFDNTGLYELLRRGLDLIVLSDAGADGDYRYDDLANAIERARADFGVGISFRDGYGLDQVSPGTDGNDSFGTRLDMARRGYAVANIRYTNGRAGLLIVMKPTLIRGLPQDIYRYRALNPSFPAQSTADQFFGERQLEAYRELGYQLTRRMVDEGVVTDWFNT